LSHGATKKRDVAIPGREHKGVYFAEQFRMRCGTSAFS
jgi:NADPH-dependent glutamate synthase beta subunit-like oxidoreductase